MSLSDKPYIKQFYMDMDMIFCNTAFLKSLHVLLNWQVLKYRRGCISQESGYSGGAFLQH